MAKTVIDVERNSEADPYEFAVTIEDGQGKSRHQVTMSESSYQGLKAGDATPEECIRAAFKFLLDRESKESILSQFDVMVISRYFPEFKDQFPQYL